MLGQLAGWAEGQTGNEAGAVELRVYRGVERDGALFIDPASFIEGDPARGAQIRFDETSIRGGGSPRRRRISR